MAITQKVLERTSDGTIWYVDDSGNLWYSIDNGVTFTQSITTIGDWENGSIFYTPSNESLHVVRKSSKKDEIAYYRYTYDSALKRWSYSFEDKQFSSVGCNYPDLCVIASGSIFWVHVIWSTSAGYVYDAILFHDGSTLSQFGATGTVASGGSGHTYPIAQVVSYDPFIAGFVYSTDKTYHKTAMFNGSNWLLSGALTVDDALPFNGDYINFVCSYPSMSKYVFMKKASDNSIAFKKLSGGAWATVSMPAANCNGLGLSCHSNEDVYALVVNGGDSNKIHYVKYSKVSDAVTGSWQEVDASWVSAQTGSLMVKRLFHDYLGVGRVDLLYKDAVSATVFEWAFAGATIEFSDSGSGDDTYTLVIYVTFNDSGTAIELIEKINIAIFSDEGSGNDAIGEIRVTAPFTDSGFGLDDLSLSKTFFHVDSDGILQPLGLRVTRDSKKGVLSSIEHFTEEVPGRHGEYIFGYRLRGRVIELTVVSEEEFTIDQREQIKRQIAQYLNPLKGEQPLVFADDPEKTYYVKYAGKIDLNQYPSWLHFTIPFKSSQPYVYGSFSNSHIGSGTITNDGNVETPVTIEIAGPVTDPSVIVGSDTLSYAGTVEAGEVLVIDTEKLTVELDGSNVLQNHSGGFPKLPPGNTEVTAAAGGTTTFKYRARWLY